MKINLCIYTFTTLLL